jgi:hypothetical protein
MKREFPTTLISLGIPANVVVWLLAIRLVWEQTVWTWEHGGQMVGFALMHSLWGPFLLIAFLASLIWPVIVLIVMLAKRSLGGGKVVTLLALYVVGLGLVSAPYGFWQRLFISKFSPAQAIELMTYAAAEGDVKTVSAFLDRGVSVNEQGRYGTALHAAAVHAEIEVMEYLINKGADVNAINPFGDSPMANTPNAELRSAEARALLEKHGGRLIRGTPEQRDKVIEQHVREDMERMEKDMPKRDVPTCGRPVPTCVDK